MKNLKALGSGLTGAIALTASHQIFKTNSKDAPKVDSLGMQAVTKIFKAVGAPAPEGKKLYGLSLAGDILFNSLYYSFVSTGKKPLTAGSLLGASSGLGVLTLPKVMKLTQDFTTRKLKTKIMSFAIYLIGGWVAAAFYKRITV